MTEIPQVQGSHVAQFSGLPDPSDAGPPGKITRKQPAGMLPVAPSCGFEVQHAEHGPPT